MKAWREADLPDDEQQQSELQRRVSAAEEPAPLPAARQLDYGSDDGWGGWGETVSGSAAGDGASRQDDAPLSSSKAAVDDSACRLVDAEATRRCLR